MRGCAILIAFAAWATLQVPWVRCVGHCHDRVVPAHAPHECHAHHAPAQESGGEVSHQSLDFAAVLVAAAAVADVPRVASPVAPPVPRTPSQSTREAPAPNGSPPLRVVLLL